MSLKNLPIGIQTFKDIIDGNYLYIDKTKYLYNLIDGTKGVYFLSRPRRFGKSLTLSTLREIFEGNKELFRGLWIYSSDYDWQKYPVLRFDFSKMKPENKEELKEAIVSSINENARNYDIKLDEQNYTTRFDELLYKLKKKTGKQVVVLVDEYDGPIIQHITNIPLATEMREVLKGFYTILKASDEYIRFILLTGVSKFSKTGVFSGLNNLKDITMSDKYSSMLGITQDELEIDFKEYIKDFATNTNQTEKTVLAKLKRWYNGYRLSENGTSIYNPFSTLNALKNHKFTNYWFETGTPSFLINLIKKENFEISEIPFKADMQSFTTYELEHLNPIPLLFQTGYLTISDYEDDEDGGLYTLDYPNFEVKNSFLKALFYRQTNFVDPKSYIVLMSKAIKRGDLDEVFLQLSRLFRQIPYDLQINLEKYYQNLFFLIFKMLGFSIDVEVKTDIGRIDAVVITDQIYIFEFKLYNEKKKPTKEDALNQIKDKKYYERYLAGSQHNPDSKDIILIGALFTPKAEEEYFDWIVEELK